MATYAIGDIQGCFDELQTLLEIINYKPNQDQLWFAGDLVNRGPKSLQSIRFIKQLPNTICVLGNHDLHLLALAHNAYPEDKTHNMHEILNADDCPQLLEWLRNLPLLHHDPKLNITMVHAGLVPQWDLNLAQQCAKEVEDVLRGELMPELLSNMYGDSPDIWNSNLTGYQRLRFIINCLTRIRFCDENGRLNLQAKGSLSEQPTGYIPWFKVTTRASQNDTILFGHWAALQAETQTPNVYALDGGCVWGGKLIAMRLEDKQIFSVQSQQ